MNASLKSCKVDLVMLCILRSRSKTIRAEIIVETDMRISSMLKSAAPIKMCSQAQKGWIRPCQLPR